MISDAIEAARQDLMIRELIERADMREMCLRVLCAFSGDVPPALVPDPGPARQDAGAGKR